MSQHMNNIFQYAPKELATDAFLAWYFTELVENTASQGPATSFFYSLGLCKCASDRIHDIHVSRQEKNTDLILRYSVNGKKVQALFENKTYTSTHSGQLERYLSHFGNFDYYKYLKLGYVTFSERKEAEKLGYGVIDVYRLRSALGDRPSNMIADQYRDYLDTRFIALQHAIRDEMIQDNKYQLLKHSEAQQHILSTLHEQLDGAIPNLHFKPGANVGGSPWTQLDIAKRNNAYAGAAECLYWRIDMRKKRYYLRLNQYSNIDEHAWPRKEHNLNTLRDYVSKLLVGSGLVLGPVSNRGMKESEVAIIFFADNNLSNVVPLMPSLSKDIYGFYSSFSNWV